MIKLFSIVLVLCQSLLHGNQVIDEPSMIPLEEYCKQNDIDNDVAALGYVCLRCACLYTVIVATMGNRIDAYGGDKKEVRNYLEWATAFSMI